MSALAFHVEPDHLTLVFFIAAWYIRRYLDEQGIPKGMTRSLLVVGARYSGVMGSRNGGGLAQEQIEEPHPVAQTMDELPLPAKESGQTQP